MARLHDELERGNLTAVPQFWSEMEGVDFIQRFDFGFATLREESTWGGNFFSAGRISPAKLRFINNALSSGCLWPRPCSSLSPMESPS
jgi:hypothetical protein